MPGTFIAAIIIAILAAIILIVRATAKMPKDRKIEGWASVFVGAVAAFFLLVSMYNPVGTKEEGIETTFGATSGHLSNGFHLTWPWVKVHEMDAAIQTDSFTGQQCLQARIANQQTGCVNVSIRWRIVPASVDELYKDYRSFAHVRDSLVTRKLTAAVNSQVASYNPLDAVSAAATSTGKPSKNAPSLQAIADGVKQQMQHEIGSSIEVIDVILPLITFDDATQQRINQLQQQFAETRIAKQQEQTNIAQAEANKALAKSVNTSPNVLVSKCLDIFEEMVKDGQTIPPGFNPCWPGSSSAVIVPAAASAK